MVQVGRRQCDLCAVHAVDALGNDDDEGQADEQPGAEGGEEAEVVAAEGKQQREAADEEGRREHQHTHQQQLQERHSPPLTRGTHT